MVIPKYGSNSTMFCFWVIFTLALFITGFALLAVIPNIQYGNFTHAIEIPDPEESTETKTKSDTVRTYFKSGFQFSNNGYKYSVTIPTEFIIPDIWIPDFIWDGDIELTTYGRCVGMAFAALDYYYAKIPIPKYDRPLKSGESIDEPLYQYPPPPPDDTPLSKYILERHYDGIGYTYTGVSKNLWGIYLSLSPIGTVGSLDDYSKFIYFHYGPKENKLPSLQFWSDNCGPRCLPGVRPLTNAEVSKATHAIDQGKPVVLGLINMKSSVDHAVVAHGYHYNKQDKYYTFYIYDPNYPKRELKASWYPESDIGKLFYYYGDAAFEKGSSRGLVELAPWKGFFVMDYKPKTPTNILTDIDYDGIEDSKDNCARQPNPDQKDTNNDSIGDACQMSDKDKDGVTDNIDNCRFVANPDQKDEDNNGWGDVCNIIT